jgi:hypothetical protein
MADINWDAYAKPFADGIIPGSEIVSTIFIVAVAFIGLYIARWMYSQL